MNPGSMFINKYLSAKNRLILLDYDGTLVNYETTPEKATPSDQLLMLLKKLTLKPQTDIVIISGRRCSDIDKFIGELAVDIIAEHGAMIKEKGMWKRQLKADNSWKLSMLELLNKITMTCPNSFVEEKQYSLAWHYRNADPESAYLHSRELMKLLNENINSRVLRILDGNKVIEVTQTEMDKGTAVKRLLEEKDYDYILSIGDDFTDEDMFSVLESNENAITIKVGEGKTKAKFHMKSYKDVVTFLEQLAE